MYIAVHHIVMICVSMHIALINMSEHPCAIHIGYSLCYPIVGAMYIDCDNMIIFNLYLQYVLLLCLMYCFGQYVLNRLLKITIV